MPFSVKSQNSSLNSAAPKCSVVQEETDVLVQEAPNRQEEIYGSANKPLRPDDGKLAGEEVTNLVNCCSGPPQTAAQSRKRFNDIRKRARNKLEK